VYRREFVGMEDCMQEVGRDEAKGGNMGIERLAGKKGGREVRMRWENVLGVK